MNPDIPQRVPIKEHFEAILVEKDKRYEQRFNDQEKAVSAALTAAKEAVVKAETAAEKRFDSVNEFRKTLSDQTSTFIPRPEYTQRLNSMDEKINSITRICVGAVMLGIAVITVVLLILRHS
jgi:phosphopantetheinyl transferase (holo-ACP synthase)